MSDGKFKQMLGHVMGEVEIIQGPPTTELIETSDYEDSDIK